MAGITLAQVAQQTKSEEVKFIARRLLRDAKPLEILPFQPVTTLQVHAMWWEKLPTGGYWRSLNEGYSSSEDGQFGDGTESLFGFGTDITFDKVLQQLTGFAKDPVQVQTEGKLKSMALDFNYYFINGDVAVNAKAISGLKKRVAALPTRQTVYAAASNAAALDPTATAAAARAFLDKLDTAWRYCNAGDVSAIFANEDFGLGLGRVLRYLQLGGNILDTTKDSWDREFLTYRGKPIIDMGLRQDMATEVITNTEVGGDTNANSTSAYFVSFNSEDGLTGIQLNDMKAYDPLNGGEMEAKPSKLLRVDWWAGLATFGRYGITRLRNVKAPGLWT